MTEPAQPRADAAIQRTHQRFLLRNIHFAHQFALMYRCRQETLHQRTYAAVRRRLARAGGVEEEGAAEPPLKRVLELAPGQRAISIGVLYKHMKLFTRFLDEYQKELVRIDAGDDDDDDDDGGGGGGAGVVDLPSAMPQDELEGADRVVRSHCSAGDDLFLEDSSGRVILDNLPIDALCTGIVIGVYGTLKPNGRLQVLQYAMCGVAELWVPRALARLVVHAAPGAEGAPAHTPCFVAFVCDLAVGVVEAPVPAVELLVDFLAGNLGDPAMVAQAAQVSRLVIGGNLVAPTEELQLKKKVKLDHSDHAKLKRSARQQEVILPVALMREADQLLSRLADTIEVELMPGDNDPSNALLPQQPLHPVLLPLASRKSSLKLVTNPYEFGVTPQPAAAPEGGVEAPSSGAATRFFVSAGQNVEDVARETVFATDRLSALGLLLQCGCACPTAPNSLLSYPFQDSDPFLFTAAPHCLVACNQPSFETRLEPLSSADEAEADDQAAPPRRCTRLVCVPSFAQRRTVVLVDVNSPTLETVAMEFL